jgi:streptogramin lyase
MYSNVDGKVWTNNQEDSLSYRLDRHRQVEVRQAKTPGGKRIRAYGMPTDHQNSLYQLNSAATASAGAMNAPVTIWPTATPLSRPRRGRVDSRTPWFAEYGGNGIGLFDPKTDTIKGGGCPRPGARPTWSRSRTAPRLGPARC